MKFILVVFLTALLLSCTDNSVNPDIEIEFGESYSIEMDSSSPKISQGTLIVKVAFSGCDNTLEFELKSIVKSSVTKLWLYKKTSNGLCDAYFEEELKFALTQTMLNSSKIVLITPDNDEIILKQ